MSRADSSPAAPTPGAPSLRSPQRRRRASAPRPPARFLFLPRERRADDAPRTGGCTGKPRPSGKWPRRAGLGDGGGAAVLTVPPLGLGFAVQSWTLTAAESLISDLVACWGIAVPAEASLRFTAHSARARSHLGIPIGSSRGPEPRIPSW